jgi:hypothetical protein
MPAWVGDLGWLRLLARGWHFTDWIVEPMIGHHGACAVLMTKA